MKLIVHELNSYVEQRIFCPRILNLAAVRLHLYKHNAPAGKIKVQLRSEEGFILSESEEINITDISSAPFFHGQVRFYINYQLQAEKHYKLRLVHEDYSFTEQAYVGWCADFDFNTYEKDFDDPNLSKSPLDYEIWERK